MILALALGVLIIFGGVVWNTYRQGIRPAGEGLPPVLAEERPYKRVADPVPAKTRSVSDLRIYDNWDQDLVGNGNPALAGGAALNEGVNALSLADATEAELESLEGPEAATPPVATDLPAVSRAPPPSPLRPLGRTASYSFSAEGPFLVQLAALQSEESAERAWRRISSSEPELYYGANKFIQRADLGAQGVFYRLRVGAFTDRSDAVAFCEAVKEAGTNCIVVTG